MRDFLRRGFFVLLVGFFALSGCKEKNKPPSRKAPQTRTPQKVTTDAGAIPPKTRGMAGKGNNPLLGGMKLMVLRSPAFEPGAKIPDKYACGAKKKYQKPSVPLQWSKVPKGAMSLVLLVDDLHPVARGWVHWVVVDIPVGVTSLPEGVSGTKKMPPGSAELLNTWGKQGYGGPCPPANTGKHIYRFRLYARKSSTTQLQVKGKTGKEIAAQLTDSIGVGELRGFFPAKSTKTK